MGFPSIHKLLNDIARSNLKNKDICTTAVQRYYDELGKAYALKEASKVVDPIIAEADEAQAKDEEANAKVEGAPAEEVGEEANVEGEAEATPKKALAKMNKNELLAECSALGLADKVDVQTMTNKDLIELIKSA